MRKIKRLSEEYDFKIVEDASHAIGGSMKDIILVRVGIGYMHFQLSSSKNNNHR